MASILASALMCTAPSSVWAQAGVSPGEENVAETAVAPSEPADDMFMSDDVAALVTLFLADPEAFLDEREADDIAAFIERLITDDPGAIGSVLTALARATDQRAQGAIADGIARAVARLSAEGREAASAGILARIAIEGSPELLRSVAESSEQYSAEIAAAGVQDSLTEPVAADVIVAPEIISAPADPPPIVGAGADGGAGDSGRDALSPVTNAPGIDDGRTNTATGQDETPSGGGIANFRPPRPASPVAGN